MDTSELTLIAYLDDELPPPARAALERALAEDPQLKARLEAHRKAALAVRAAFVGVTEEPIPERLLRPIQAATPHAIGIPPRLSAAAWPAGAAIAAGLVLSVGLGFFTGRATAPAAGDALGPRMAARGALARALDTQLASTAGSSAVRIGLTFRATDGHVCRTFHMASAEALAGLACHRNAGWQVVLATPWRRPDTQGDYRLAAGEMPPAVADLAQAMAVGAPLDAAAEARARSAGWR